MEIKEYEIFADACFRDTAPPCGARCPFGLDVREFVRQLQKGNYRSAYRAYQKAVLFPQIVSTLCTAPCKNACVRARRDRAVELPALEKICIGKIPNLQPTRYARMKKAKTVAVIGGGLSGLAFAHRMSSWGYPVTVYEKKEQIGGWAADNMDRETCLAELSREFSILDCQFVTGREITCLEEITADGIYIATGAGGSDFDAQDRESVCIGGQLAGTAPVESLLHGLQAARCLDNFFRSGKWEPFRPQQTGQEPDQRYYGLTYDYDTPLHIPGKGEEEAGRCMLCSCTACMDVCPVMEKANAYPKRACAEIIVTLKPNMSRRTGVRLLNNCTFCGKCREVCPAGVDMALCMTEARKDFYDSGALPPAFHEYWLEDLAHSRSDAARLLHRQGEGRADVLFFPGCQLGASRPDTVAGIYEKIAAHSANAALYTGCCGLPAKWAGREQEQLAMAEEIMSTWQELGRPLVLTACMSCQANLKRYCPEMAVESVYSWLARRPESLPQIQGAWQVLDPCTSAGDPQSQRAVRDLLEAMGCQVINQEPEAGCCGFGGHMYAVDPELFGVFAQRRTRDISGKAVTYCANCRDIFAARGTECAHVLDLALGRQEASQPQELQQRRENRRALKARYAPVPGPGEAPELTIPRELVEKMDRLLLLRSQVEETVRRCRETGEMVMDEGGITYGHKKFGTVTVWCGWRQGDTGPVLTAVYSHRVEVKEGKV